MSAWIVEKKNIDRILSFVSHNKDTAGYSGLVCLDCAGYDELGRRLWRMNIDAVGQRYSEKPDYSKADAYVFTSVLVSDAQAFKSAACLSYQCSEGNVPKRKLFKQLEKLESSIANKIAFAVAEKEGAEWA